MKISPLWIWGRGSITRKDFELVILGSLSCRGRAGVHIQFFEDRFQMSLYCIGGDDQLLRDLLVRQSLSEEIQDFALTIGQRAQFTYGVTCLPGLFDHAAERGAVECPFFDIGRDRMFGIDALDLLRLRDAADDDR